MSRTPLFHMLRQAVRQQARIERPERRLIGRRSVLLGGAGLAATTLLPAVGLAATARIAVVGAGLAGLSAAYELQKHKLDADIFEASSSRIGGRCFTARGNFDQNQIAEHGGEFIDTGHLEIRNLAAELDLELDDVLNPPTNAKERYFFDGRSYSLATATSDWKPFYDTIQKQQEEIGDVYTYRQSTPKARAYDAMTVSEWLAKYIPGGRDSQLGQLIEAAFAEENGADADRQGALNLITTLADDARNNFNLYYTDSDQRFHVRGGNDKIVTSLHQRLGARTQLSMPLVAIATLPDGTVRLSFKKDAATVDKVYDRVILALPFAVMRAAVDYKQAAFQPLKNRAIETLPIGASTKFQMQFTRRLWTESGCNGEMRVPSRTFQTTWEVTRKQPGDNGILNFFSGGTRAVNAGKMDNQKLAETVMKDVGVVLPGLDKLWNRKMIKDAWKGNPWSLGSYTYFPPRYMTEVRGVEAEPEGNCYFAGEHTAKETSYLNSGVESGMRAARQVIGSLP
jgi:monoamine oxidase